MAKLLPGALKASLGRLVQALAGRRVVVVGDLIADEYVLGRPERISREAPVLILEHQGRSVVPGGAANTAHAIAALGGAVRLLGVVGADPAGEELRAVLAQCGIGTEGIQADPARATAVKTRIVAGDRQAPRQQVIRIDRVSKAPIGAGTARALLEAAQEAIAWADAVILSDYGHGVCTPTLVSAIIGLCRQTGRPCIADTRYQLLTYRGASALTPSVPEVELALGRPILSDEDVRCAGFELLERLACEALVLTRGEQGLCLFQSGGEVTAVPATNPTEVFDVTGAGDTVTGTLALGIASGADWLTAAVLANIAAGIVVRKMGTRTVSPEELRAAVRGWRPALSRWPAVRGSQGASG